MKLRIRGNSLRLRLRQGEVQRLSQEGTVEETTEFGPGSQLRYVLDAREECAKISASFQGATLRVSVPRSLATEWAASEQISLIAEQNGLSLLIEKDFACLKPRSSPQWEDESDAFPNPNPSCGNPHE